MNDKLPPTQPETVPSAAPTASAAADATAKPVKPPGLIRKSVVIILLVLVALGIASFPFVVEPWIVGKVRSSLIAQGLELSPDSTLAVSVFGMGIEGNNLKLREKGGTEDVFTATKLSADVAVLDSITSGDVIIETLTLDGLTGSLRRKANGQVPIITPPDAPPGKPTDWLGLAQQLMDWYRKYAAQDEKTADGKQPGGQPTPTVPPVTEQPTDWPQAVKYKPTPGAGGHWPRVLVRSLSISGGKLGLPDDSPFDLTGFSVKGTNVALRLHADEVMTLVANLIPHGSGPFDLDLNRKGGQTGTMKLSAKALPIEALASKAISGDKLAAWGASGIADFSLDANWTGWDLAKSPLAGALSKLKLQPTKEAGNGAREVAEVVNAVDGRPLRWVPTLGGKLFAPVFTDSGLDALKSSAMAAGKDAAIDKGKEKLLEEGGKQADKLIEKNPQLKQGADAAKDATKGLLKGFGK